MPNSPLVSTQFSALIKKFLKSIDNYNSSDLARSNSNTDENTSGEVAGICINLALHQCYDLVKDSKYLQALPTQSFSSTANQDYIDLDIDPSIDEIEAITDPLNNIRLVRKTWNFYRKNFPDPSNTTGVPIIYCRRNSRIYLAPRPQSVIAYTIDFVKLTNDLSADADLPLLPQQYDYWIIAEARVFWAMMQDATQVPEWFVTERNDARQNATNAILSGYDMELEGESHWNENQIGYRDYQRPVG